MSWYSCGSAAGKRYQRTVAVEMGAYVVIIEGVTQYVRHDHPAGWVLYAVAAAPSVPILGVLIAMGRYLRDETDEYQRNVMVRCLLIGTAVVLAVTAFFGFLRSFEWKGELPPFTEFVLFWLVMASAKVYYRFADRVKDDA
jgi:RsiW-degrading membrane proteinase PrsW (M82 family)